MRKIGIFTPCYDGKIPIYYMNSLIATLDLLRSKGMDVSYDILCFNALVGLARDHLFSRAYNAHCDDALFIDSDMAWDPEDALRMLSAPADFVGAIYRSKKDDVHLMFKKVDNPEFRGTLAEVDFVGFGFVRMTKRAVRKLWNACEVQYENTGGTLKELFVQTVAKGQYVGEDVSACQKWRGLGEKIYIDLTFRASHWGNKMYDVPEYEELMASGPRP
jgi:hypothetical protein